MSEHVILCDFDGTITENDNIIKIIQHFAPPEADAIKQDVLDKKISVQDGVGQMFQLITSDLKEPIIDFVLTHAKIRPGFQELIDEVKANGGQFYVVSGGIDFFVEPMLAPFKGIDGVYCNGSDFTSETIQVLWPHTCDEFCDGGCGLCKPKVLRQFDPERFTRIVIGDSVTDFKVARIADRVFARDYLATECERLKLPHIPFTTFYDVIKHLNGLEGGA